MQIFVLWFVAPHGLHVTNIVTILLTPLKPILTQSGGHSQQGEAVNLRSVGLGGSCAKKSLVEVDQGEGLNTVTEMEFLFGLEK